MPLSPKNGDRKLKVAVHKFASCDGCQLQFLNLELELLTLADRVDIDLFWEASSHIGAGPWDVSFLEGSISAPENLERIKKIRANSKQLIAIGACATAGGIQALRNFGRYDAFVNAVYAHPKYIASLEHSTPFSDHVRIDAELHGCPPDPTQLLRLIGDLLAGVEPYVPTESVCLECKRQGNVCVLVAKGEPCLGPVTRTGCGALCPYQERDCYGCWGPQEGGNTEAMARRFLGMGLTPEDIVRRYRFIYAWRPEFKAASDMWQAHAADITVLPPQHSEEEGQ